MTRKLTAPELQPPLVLLCAGGSCRGKRRTRLATDLTARGVTIVDVPCQKICKGPVAGCYAGGRLRWFSRLRGGRRRRAFAALVLRGKLSSLLRRRRVRSSDGKVVRGRPAVDR